MSRRMQKSVSSVVAQHAGEKTPTISILGYSLAGQGLARVVVEVTHNRHSREDSNLVMQSISKAFDGKLSHVAGSFHSVDKAPFTERIEGVVRVNTEVRAVTEKMDGFRSVSSNIFADEENKMWVLRKTEAGDVIVKDTGIGDHESLRGLLDVACCSGYSLSSEFKKSTASLSSMQRSVSGGDYVEYVSASSNETRFGFVVASADEDKLIVLPADATPEDEGEVVEKEAVTAKFDVADFPEPELSEQEQMDIAVSAARGVVDLSGLLAYYKKVFARSPKFYAEFAKRARGHAFA